MSFTLSAIVLGTVVCGVGSVWLAAALSFGPLARYTHHMLSMAAGALLATALLHLLPEALESVLGAHTVLTVLLIGLIFFFLLDKAQLWHHGHEHAHPHRPDSIVQPAPAHGHAHHGNSDHPNHAHSHTTDEGPPHTPAIGGAWTILAGDSVHCFGDGVLIASAFIADMRLGALASLAVLAHEIPHHVGDLVVLRQAQKGVASSARRAAFIKVSLAGAVTTVGGIAGYFLLEPLQGVLPYFLTIASSSFVYVALADLIPQLQKQLSTRQTIAQVLWLLSGVMIVTLMSQLGEHAH